MKKTLTVLAITAAIVGAAFFASQPAEACGPWYPGPCWWGPGWWYWWWWW